MARVKHATVTAGTPRLDLWCDRCLTSAGTEADFYLLSTEGPLMLGTVKMCARCDVVG